jgi:hypothetical protein
MDATDSTRRYRKRASEDSMRGKVVTAREAAAPRLTSLIDGSRGYGSRTALARLT